MITLHIQTESKRLIIATLMYTILLLVCGLLLAVISKGEQHNELGAKGHHSDEVYQNKAIDSYMPRVHMPEFSN